MYRNLGLTQANRENTAIQGYPVSSPSSRPAPSQNFREKTFAPSSRPAYNIHMHIAEVAELVDAADLKSVASNGVRVQVPPWALFCNQWQKSAKAS